MDLKVYFPLVNFALWNKNSTLTELVNTTNEFSIPEKNTKHIVESILEAEIRDRTIVKSEDGSYHLSNSYDIRGEMKDFLELHTLAPKEYIGKKPYIKKLMEAIEKRLK